MEQFRSVVKVHFRAPQEIYRECLVPFFLSIGTYGVKAFYLLSFNKV